MGGTEVFNMKCWTLAYKYSKSKLKLLITEKASLALELSYPLIQLWIFLFISVSWQKILCLIIKNADK